MLETTCNAVLLDLEQALMASASLLAVLFIFNFASYLQQQQQPT
jgi:hypothetical protein